MGGANHSGAASGRGENFWAGHSSSGVRISARLMRGVRSSVWTVGWGERTLGRGYGEEERTSGH